jgi:hypothetical protein
MSPETSMPAETGSQKKIWITNAGLPLTIALKWPFHRSGSGADFWVLHAEIRPAGVDALHALVAVNLSATVREVLPSLEPADAEGPVINALRKEVDRLQIEFMKSAKLVPLPFSSRHYDFKRNQWAYGAVKDEDLALFLERKVFWQTKVSGGKVRIADPIDAQYLGRAQDDLQRVAKDLDAKGTLHLEGENAIATQALMNGAARFEADVRRALEELEKKHAFERG